jgi:hypothetical protein
MRSEIGNRNGQKPERKSHGPGRLRIKQSGEPGFLGTKPVLHVTWPGRLPDATRAPIRSSAQVFGPAQIPLAAKGFQRTFASYKFK